MTIIAIIQSRMTSNRYPGKMLAPFMNKPILAHVVDRIRISASNPMIVLATSDENADDPLAVYGESLGLRIVRGSRDDVMGRFILTLSKYNCEAFFRVCGDSPLLLPFLFDKAISVFKDNSPDIVTNIFPKTFPPGMSVELLKTKTFLETEKNITNKDDREHLTQYFYKHPKNFKIHNIECSKIIDSNLRFTVDQLEDLQKLKKWNEDRVEGYENLFPILKK
jgi:spore coat polysaccharide biosynthesis protein SpsF (cytidylyltransferase family)